MSRSDLFIEGAEIFFRNFAGLEGNFNPAGKRTFCVYIDPDTAQKLKDDGWNVKVRQPKKEGDDPRPYIQVEVKYSNYPPKVYLITTNKTLLKEDQVALLDQAELLNVDLVINPSHYNFNGREGIKAYLKAGYFTIAEDKFEQKYNDFPESDQGF